MRALLLLAALAALLGCSTTVLSPARCESNQDCRAAFGIGRICNTEGSCAPLALPPRCARTHPDRLFDAEENPIVIGVLSDGSVESEVVAERAVRLVAVLANQQGGLDDRTIGLVFCDVRADDGSFGDGLSRVDAALATSSLLVEEIGVRGIIGPHASSDVERVFTEVSRPAPALLISPSATNVALITLDRFPASDFTPGFLWRTVPPETQAIEAIADSLVARGVTSVFVIAPDGIGATSADTLRDALAARGGASVVDRALYPPGSRPAMIDAINTAAEALAEEIVCLTETPAESITFLTLVAGDDRFDGRGIFMGPSAAVPELLTAEADARFGRGADGYSLRVVRYSTPESMAFRNFRNQYRAEYDNEDPAPYPAAARAYDAAWLMLFGVAGGIARTGAVDAQSIAMGLRALSVAGASVVELEQSSWRSAQLALMGGAMLNVVGASGDLDFDSRTEEPSGSPEILVVDGSPGSWAWAPDPG